MENRRFREIDFLKGFGITLMIMGHIPVYPIVSRYIYQFHMPLFFIVSGFLYKKKEKNKFTELLLKWLKRLLIPYFLFSLLGYILWYAILEPTTVLAAVTPIKSIIWINTDGMPVAGAVWYLTSTFWVYVLYYVIDSYCTSMTIENICILFIALCGLATGKISLFKLPWALDIACVGLFFYNYGKILYIHKEKIFSILDYKKKVVRGGVCVTLIFISTISMFNGNVSMRTRTYGNSMLLFMFVAVVLCTLYWILSEWCVRLFPESKFIGYIESIGRNSIVYLGLNEIIITIISAIFNKIGLRGNYLIFIKLILSLAVIFVLIEIIKKIKWLADILAVC